MIGSQIANDGVTRTAFYMHDAIRLYLETRWEGASPIITDWRRRAAIGVHVTLKLATAGSFASQMSSLKSKVRNRYTSREHLLTRTCLLNCS